MNSNYDYSYSSSRPSSQMSSQMNQSIPQSQSESQFFHHNNANGGHVWSPQSQSNNDYYMSYVSEYYRQYYERMVMQSRLAVHSQRSVAARAPQTPFKHHCSHARASFSACGRLVVLDNGNTRVSLVPLSDIASVGRSWPLFDRSPLAKLSVEDARRVALQWLAWRSSEVGVSPELALVLRVVTTLLKQSGHVCGADLTEVLLTPEPEEDVAPEEPTFVALRRFRRLLARGQREAAILHASDSGLHAHALTLSVLSNGDACTASSSHVIRRFISTLSREDPLYVLYSSLLSSERVVTREWISLESFIILVSNDVCIDATRLPILDCHFPNLIQLIVSLSENSFNYDFVVNVFNDDFCDHVILNECLEFGRSLRHQSRVNCYSNDLLLQKLVFASILFDFGFHLNAINYCDVIQQSKHKLTKTAKHVLNIIESRVNQTDIQINDTEDTETYTNYDVINETEIMNEIETIDTRVITTTQSQQSETNSIVDNNETIDESRHVSHTPPLIPMVNSVGASVPLLTTRAFDDNLLTFVSNSTPIAVHSNPIHNDLNDDVIHNEDFYDKMVSNEMTRDDTLLTNNEQNNEKQNQNINELNNTSYVSSQQRSSGIIESFWGKLKSRHVPQATRAKLPDDTNKSIVWDEKRKQWIDLNETTNEIELNTNVLNGPPIRPPIQPPIRPTMTPQSNRFRSGIGSRYVDIFNQNSNTIKLK